jgi:hypothetical protein
MRLAPEQIRPLPSSIGTHHVRRVRRTYRVRPNNPIGHKVVGALKIFNRVVALKPKLGNSHTDLFADRVRARADLVECQRPGYPRAVIVQHVNGSPRESGSPLGRINIVDGRQGSAGIDAEDPVDRDAESYLQGLGYLSFSWQ